MEFVQNVVFPDLREFGVIQARKQADGRMYRYRHLRDALEGHCSEAPSSREAPRVHLPTGEAVRLSPANVSNAETVADE